ncbi:response regulator [Anaeromyxobacter paludicola]|uniref:Response regulatory domain-containing protein n=1 Tax=Anaeromyxobacter paludicola TaxID=2918171 RepID=A0ABM7X8Y0_9BACT|nr:response regulator [Anaeromyxobacter paludicola]BDG08303.1 hypothetical protein AMPC_14160 [Anaeromyxobacter paludicola]
MKLLIADDDRLIRAMLSDILAELGHTVVAAADGEEAVRLYEAERPDAVILDFLMPRLSGLDALQAMRRGGARVPAALLTAISDDSVRAVDGGDAPDAYLEKPFRRRTIERALAELARAARAG